jgi:hypothetical protein
MEITKGKRICNCGCGRRIDKGEKIFVFENSYLAENGGIKSYRLGNFKIDCITKRLIK